MHRISAQPVASMDLKIDSTIVINGNKLLISQKIKESHFILKALD